MQLSKHFKSEEFACKCGCGFDSVSMELIEVLEDLRSFYGNSVTISSGCRCAEHNVKVGGEPKSQHMYGTAADVIVKNENPRKVYVYLDSKYPDKYGIGSYEGWTHIDVREKMARWIK